MKARKLSALLLVLVLGTGLVPVSAASNTSTVGDNSFPEKFDLRDYGVVTPVKTQNPWLSCWAFGGISSVESNLLRKRHNDFDNPAAYSLDLGSASSEPDLSELFLAYENCEPVVSGPQSGEGMSPLSNDINNHFSVGGFASSLQSIFAAWDGPVSEEQEPYKPVSAEDSGAAVYDLRSEDKDRNDPPAAHIQKFIYLDDSVQFHVDLDRKVYAFDSCDQQAVDRAKQALYQYGALMLCYGADMSMPNEAGDATYFDYNHWSQYSSADTIAMNHMVSVVGWNDNSLYDGIEEMLRSHKDNGMKLAVATSKPELMSERIISYFGISEFFDTICGSVPGERHTKSDVIAEVFSRLKIKDRSKVLMVGDRKQDIEGAHKMGISAMGVLYGYGSREEFERAGADFIAETPADVKAWNL